MTAHLPNLEGQRPYPPLLGDPLPAQLLKGGHAHKGA